jgi:hypothetical protein
MPSAVHEINSAFNQRLEPIKGLGAARPVNPFASTGVQTSETKRDEMTVRSSVTLPGRLGTRYKEKVMDNKSDDSVLLDSYTIGENPHANINKHSTSRLKVEHTRER